MRVSLFFALLLLSGAAVAHMPVTTTGAGVLYDASMETMTVGNPLDNDHTGVASDRPNSIDNNLTAIVTSGAAVTPSLNNTKFVRLTEACGEAPDLAFDRAIALGTANSPNAIAHVAVDFLVENSEQYHIYFRNGLGSGIDGAASQVVANIGINGTLMTFESLGGTNNTTIQIGAPIHLDAFFDLGRNTWSVFVNGTRVLNAVSIIDSPLGFVAIGFDFSCPFGTTGPTSGAMQFDNFVFEQVTEVPGVLAPATIATVATGLGRPFGVAIHGTFAYVPDPQSHSVWQVDLTNGTKKTVAGTGEQGYNGDGIDATVAQLDNPSGVAVDAAGALYIADTGNHAIRKVATPGVDGALITTVAGIPTNYAVGEGIPAGCASSPPTVPVDQCVPATGLRLFGPRGLALDSAGNLYIADRMNQQIKKLYTSGPLSGLMFVVAGIAGVPGSIDGPISGPLTCGPDTCALGARFNSPVGLAVDGSGNVYVAEEGGNKIRYIPANPDGPPNVTTLSGTTGALLRPTGVAVDTTNFNVYIANYGNNVISLRSCVAACTTVTVAGTGTAGSGGTSGGPATAMQLNSPIGVALDGFLLYIADLLNGRLLVVNLTPVIIP